MKTRFTAREVISALTRYGFVPVERTGSHLKLRYEHPENDADVRVVEVPVKSGNEDLPVGTLQSIARQSGANEYHEWCRWLDDAL